MRKIVILAGLLMGAALFTGTPAKADVGCGCVKLGAAPVCTSTIIECNAKVGGVCVTPCIYEAPKAVKKGKRVKKKK